MGRQSAHQLANRSSAIAARNDAIGAMNPALKAICAELQSSMVDRIEDNLRFYHRIGKRCQDIKQHPEKYLTEEQRLNGVDPFALLETAMGTSRETIRKAASFAEKYDSEDLKRLFAYRNDEDKKFRLHWGHVSYLLSVDNARQRIKFEEDAVKNLWDPAELHKQITKHYGGPRKSGGRPLGIPKSVPAQISQIRNMTGLWLRRDKEIWNGAKHSVFNNILQLTPDKYTPDMLKELQGLKTQWDEMRSQLDNGLKTVDNVIQQVAQAVSGEGEAAPTKASPKPAAADDAPPRVGSQKSPTERARATAARVTAGARNRPVPR